jgi:membrane protein implicated in regulation of membrane protease activity
MLTLAYIALALIGCGYIVVSAFLGHLFEFSESSHGADGAHAGTHVHAHPQSQVQSSTESYGVGATGTADGVGHGTATAHGAGGPEFHFPFFSPLALATLFAAIGAYGLIALHGFKVGETLSLLIAVAAAFVTAYAITYLAFKMVTGARASSMIRIGDLPGKLAEVTTPIPEGGLGEAVAMVGGQRYAASAREEGGRAVPRGAAVTVVGLVGSTLVVRAGILSEDHSRA